VGTTTTAVNVATALAKVAPSQTLFADLHVANGDAALLFGVEPRFSIADALENTHRFDEAFFRGLVTPTKAKADLLASSDRALVQQSGMPHFRPVVEFAVQLYRYVILDVPRPDAMAIDALDLASRIVVVTNQELSAVRSASRLASAMRSGLRSTPTSSTPAPRADDAAMARKTNPSPHPTSTMRTGPGP